MMSEEIETFAQLIRCGTGTATSLFSAEGKYLESDSPHGDVFAQAFDYSGSLDIMLGRGEGRNKPIAGPAIIGKQTSLVWGVDASPSFCHGNFVVLGPVRLTSLPNSQGGGPFKGFDNTDFPIAWKQRFLAAQNEIPDMPNIMFMRDLLMLHYWVAHEHVELADISKENFFGTVVADEQSGHDRRKIWQAEQLLLQAVTNGDIDHKDAYSKSAMLSTGVPVRAKDPLRQAQTSVTVFISLCVRAAMIGGLSPEIAYPLGDRYIQLVEQAENTSALMSIAPTMYEEFVMRVRQNKNNPQYSLIVRRCIELIGKNLGSRITADSLASSLGYSPYYLTRKFKEETGLSLTSYVRKEKMLRAKTLLRGSDLSVGQIASQLGYETRSYFSQVFLEVEGYTPTRYRDLPDVPQPPSTQ